VVTVPLGPEEIEVSGGVVSMVHVKDAGWLRFPAPSMASTWKVCEPAPRPE
jgi:hypothetical protein